MKKGHKLFYRTILIPFLLLVYNIQAQESRILSLNAAIELSLNNSKQLKVSRVRIDEAIAATKEATDRRQPDFAISSAFMRLNKPDINMKTASNGGNNSGEAPTSVSQVLYGMANVSLPIYAGLKIKYGIESAQFLEYAVRLDAENDKQGIILNTISAYINLYKKVHIHYGNHTKQKQRSVA